MAPPGVGIAADLLQVVRRREVLQRLDARVHDLGELARARAQPRVGREERGGRASLLEKFEDGHGLRDAPRLPSWGRLVEHEDRDLSGWVERPEGLRALLRACPGERYRHGLVREPLPSERDADAPSRA